MLIQSDDNGRTWRRPQSQPSSAAGFLDAARLLSMTSGIAFLGPVEAAGGHLQGRRETLTTVDDGHTWHTQALPAAAQSCQIAAGQVWGTSGMSMIHLRLGR